LFLSHADRWKNSFGNCKIFTIDLYRRGAFLRLKKGGIKKLLLNK
jgi:hypothetical protein